MTFVDNLQKDSLPYLADEVATAALLKRILLFLEDGEFIQADLYCEKVLDTEPENPLAYLYKLMASRRISSLKDLASAQYIIDDDNSYKKAVRNVRCGGKRAVAYIKNCLRHLRAFCRNGEQKS